MKKFYSLLAVAAISMTVSAQGSQGFTNEANTAGSGYTTVTFSGENDTTWTITDARILDTSSDIITGKTVLAKADGSIEVKFPNGVGTLNFDYKKAFTGNTARKVEVYVDGTLVNTSPSFGTSGDPVVVKNLSTTINKSGNVVVKVVAKGAQTSFDNFVWTNPTMAVGDINSSKANLVKNTVVANEIIFGQDAKVSVINMAGQVVKTADVKDNSRLDVSNLAKGTYVVTATVNGKAVSQKIIKK